MDYQKMYHILCSAASSALDLLAEAAETAQARAVLQNALWEAEELYLSAEEER